MIALMLERAGLDPTFVVGGVVRDLGVSGKLGQGRHMVAEADEYDERFLQLRPEVAVVTNIDADHLDVYKTMENLIFTFSRFEKQIAPGGWLVACGDDRLARQLGESRSLASLGTLRDTAGLRGNSLLYGLGESVDVQGSNLAINPAGGYDFTVRYRSDSLGEFRTAIPGVHNVRNALAAITVARLVGAPTDAVRQTLADFHGAARRFEVKGERNGVTVVDDYAHHPTEIKATLAGARGRYAGRRIVAVHQPHTYSRLRNLLDEFAGAFADADIVLMCDIYASRETDTLGMHSRTLVERMHHADARYVGGLPAAVETLKGLLAPGDVLMTLGAGDVNAVGDAILAGQ
jgi:UDP-N-acetylmuramate--alanine ligase